MGHNRTINCIAPIRICDMGGWTDTWFAKHGKVLNIGVNPCVEVQIQASDNCPTSGSVLISTENYGHEYTYSINSETWNHNPMVEAAIKSVGIPPNTSVKVNIYSEVPPGASTGTSAAVSVALIGGLLRLSGRDYDPSAVALMAHEVETRTLGLQSGIQDQLCSAHGGINYIDMHEFPRAVASQLNLSVDMLYELDRRLVLMFLGKLHSSSATHDLVIKELENSGPECGKIQTLRKFAPAAAEALLSGDLRAFGLLMTENTRAQAALHDALVGEDAWRVMKTAESYGALGCKVNGAGGDGGSVTILCGDDYKANRNMIMHLSMMEGMKYKYIPTHISRHGVYAWEL